MNQPVKDRISECGVADAVVPFFGRQLAGSQCGAYPVAVFQDFQQVTAVLCGQCDKIPVIEDQDMRFRQGGEELGIASIPLSDCHVLQESGQAQVQGCVAVPAGCVCQGTGQPGFAHAGGAGDEDIEVFADPLAGGQRLYQGFVQSPRMAIVDILQGGIMLESGVTESSIQCSLVLASCSFIVQCSISYTSDRCRKGRVHFFRFCVFAA